MGILKCLGLLSTCTLILKESEGSEVEGGIARKLQSRAGMEKISQMIGNSLFHKQLGIECESSVQEVREIAILCIGIFTINGINLSAFLLQEGGIQILFNMLNPAQSVSLVKAITWTLAILSASYFQNSAILLSNFISIVRKYENLFNFPDLGSDGRKTRISSLLAR